MHDRAYSSKVRIPPPDSFLHRGNDAVKGRPASHVCASPTAGNASLRKTGRLQSKDSAVCLLETGLRA